MTPTVPYERGLHEVADGVFAWLQPDGGWGWSNAGLVRGDGGSLLVDTLFDLALTREMLEAMAPITATDPIETLVNTHANGDHCYGNQLVAEAEVIASAASAAEMDALPPSALAVMTSLDLGDAGNRYVRGAFGPFRFDDIEPPHPDRTFSGRLDVEVAGEPVELLEVGPAHTAGDVLVHLPRRQAVFTGDILFIGGTPIVWDGPIQNWLDACDRILELEPEVIVPGHGPLTGAEGVRATADYLRFVREEATQRHDAGLSATEAAWDIDLGPFGDWNESERIALNVDAVYREVDDTYDSPGVLALFSLMGELKDARS
ncbi:MAG TPA: MBL fold metallo-hydrolase [Acidimicrobiales bacterium]|nr:MBL fold metallo-hydrolase [Acidimicrobiales bacterium]